MKKITGLILTTVLCFGSLSCSVEKDNVIGFDFESYPFDGSKVIDIFFSDASNGYIVGLDGMIQKTINGGLTWVPQESGTTLNLTSVFFINDSLGYATGEFMTQCSDVDCNRSSILLKTINGGENWTKEFKNNIARFYDLWFFNENDGIAVLMTMESETFIATTNNGGDTWDYLNLQIQNISFISNQSIEKIFVKDDVSYILGGNQLLYMSKDFGKSWKTIHTPIHLKKACFITSTLGFITDNKDIFKTSNGGESWEELSTASFSIGLFHFYDELNGFNIQYLTEYIGGDFPTAVGSVIYNTSNSGFNWDEREVTDIISGYTHFPTDKLGYCINQRNLFVLRKN